MHRAEGGAKIFGVFRVKNENVGPFDDNELINEYVIIFQHFIQYVHFSVKCA
jgi:hypothetical protein